MPGEWWYFGREAAQRVDTVRRHRTGLPTESFSRVLKRLRLRQKVTQKALAAALHVTPEDVSALETETRSPKSFDEILWIGAALGLNVVETNTMLRADDRRELDEEERVLFIKLRLQLAYPFMERPERSAEACLRCGTDLAGEGRCPRCGSSFAL